MGKEPDLYKPAEACRIAEVAPYVLRYWETEFPVLSDGKEKGASRLYSTRDVKMIARIRELLYDEGFTVAGAKKRLESEVVEGRFDDGLAPAPPVDEQKKAKKAASAATAAPAAAAASAIEPTTKTAVFPERKQVVRELKEIAKLLDRNKKR